jgi:hypothetical protein
MKLKSKDGHCDDTCALWSPLRCRWSGIVDQPLDGCPIQGKPDGEYNFRFIEGDMVEVESDCCLCCYFYANCDKSDCPVYGKPIGTYQFALEIL